MDPLTPVPQPSQNQTAPPSAAPTTPASEPAKYKVFQSLKEIASSIAKNPVSTLLPLGLSILVSIIFTLVAAVALAYGGVNTTIVFSDVILIVVIAIAVFGVELVVLTSLTNAYSLALRGSYDGEKKPASAYLKDGFRIFWRAFVATILYTLTVLGGCVVLLIPAFAFTLFNPVPTVVTILFFLLGIAGLAWTIVALLRFALSVQVAIFEPNTPLLKVLSRSNHLMMGGGQWFAVKAVLLLVVIYILIAIVTGNGSNVNGQSELNIAGTLLTSLLTPFVYGVMTMLYRNRVAVRK